MNDIGLFHIERKTSKQIDSALSKQSTIASQITYKSAGNAV